jgi:hypothetical protein
MNSVTKRVTDASITLGRDGMGEDASQEAWLAWVAYVMDNIEEQAAVPGIEVDTRRPCDVQTDRVWSPDAEEREAMAEALRELWDRFCSL